MESNISSKKRMLNKHIQRFFESEKNTYGILQIGSLHKNESDLCKESVFVY